MSNAFLGIDTGSISTKGVIILPDGTIIARSYLWTEGNPTDAARRVVEDLHSQINTEEISVVAVGTTGSARRLVGSILDATVVKNEITAHAVGTTHLHPDVRTILEIGGQDSKIICVENGIATDYAMNTLCAAGTGSFLSSQAHRLGVEVEEFGPIALTSKKPANIAARCTVFAESEVVSLIGQGAPREDIAYAVVDSIAGKVVTQAKKLGGSYGAVCLTGGLCQTEYLPDAIAEKLGAPVLTHPQGRFAGAIGAALAARRLSR